MKILKNDFANTFVVKYKNDHELGSKELNSLYDLKVVIGIQFDS